MSQKRDPSTGSGQALGHPALWYLPAMILALCPKLEGWRIILRILFRMRNPRR